MKLDDRQFEARARSAFDASVEALDGATRSRLTQARHRALSARKARSAWPSLAVPVGAAAAAVLAVALWTGRDAGPASAPQAPTVQGEWLDLLAAGEDLELLGEDPEFYAWAASVAEVG
jgi:negative regulator of sigma E activity